jgi:selenocysteine-specific elongation factor
VDAAPDRVATTIVAETGAAGLARRALVARTGLSSGDIAALLGRLEESGVARDLGGVIVAQSVLDALARDVLSDLQGHHQEQPLSEGLPREELRSRRFARAADAVFEHVLDQLATANRIGGRDRIALASHRLELSPAEQQARERIEDAFRGAALKPVAPAELPALLGLEPALVERVVKLLVRQRVLIRIDDLLFHADALARLKAAVQQLKGEGQPAKVDVGSFKEKFGVTRKFAIPLLEYLDRERVTRRVGDARVVL